jgi:hypothetical protein
LGDDFIGRNFGLFMIRCDSSSRSPRKSCKKTMSERRNECFPAWNHNKRGLISSVIWIQIPDQRSHSPLSHSVEVIDRPFQ